MAGLKENCKHCMETFYRQSLLPLELVDFPFGDQKLTLIGCFVESTADSVASDCPKICRTCLDLLRTTFVGGEHSLANVNRGMKSSHICATCAEFYPSNVMMSMQLTILNYNGQPVQLLECYEICTKQGIPSGGSIMICLACVSTLAYEYSHRTTIKIEVDDEEETGSMLGSIKVEPIAETLVKGDFQDAGDEETAKIDCKTEPDTYADFLPTSDQSDSDSQSKIQSSNLPSNQHRTAVNAMRAILKSEDLKLALTYECAFCQKIHETKKKLIRHMRQHRTERRRTLEKDESKSYWCSICQKNLSRKNSYMQHLLNRHHKGETYKCHHCPAFKALTKKNIEDHLLLRHFEIERKCSECDKVFGNESNYQKHMRIHTAASTVYQCPSCKKTFRRISTYEKHMRTQKFTINCQQCDAVFHSAMTLDAHMANFHNKVYTCEICKFPLGKLETYNIHMLKKHGIHQKPRCRHCGIEFESTEQLAAHMKCDHMTGKDYICELCGQSFIHQTTLASHVKRHNKVAERKSVKCHLCGKMLRHSKSLESHIKVIHLKMRQRPQKIEYICPKCPQWKFPGRQSLGGHMIVHNTENRPFFQCLKCGMAYTRKQKYDVHVTKCPNSNNFNNMSSS